MVATVLDGRKEALSIQRVIAEKVSKRKCRGEIIPTLAVILVGNDPASRAYVESKTKACDYVGFGLRDYHVANSIQEDELINLVQELNDDRTINGILVQLPLPKHIKKEKILECVSPIKDVDGFHPYNLGRLCQRRPMLRPCTPKGIMRLLSLTGETLLGKDALVIGASEIVGRPMALELLLQGCTVSITHRFTHHLSSKTAQADILISAAGCPNLVKESWVKLGAVVIDVGLTRMQDGTLSGDVNFENVKKKAKWITPVPGGVGPMTVASLLENTLEATCMQTNMLKKTIDPYPPV